MIIFLLFTLSSSSFCFSQIEEGKWMASGNLASDWDITHVPEESKRNYFWINIEGAKGKFISNNFAVGGNIRIRSIRTKTLDYTAEDTDIHTYYSNYLYLGPYLQYYFIKKEKHGFSARVNFKQGVNVRLNSNKTSKTSALSTAEIKAPYQSIASLIYSYFPAKNVSLDIYTNHTLLTSNNSTTVTPFSLSVGFTIFY